VVPFCLASLWLAYKFVPTTAPGGVAAVRGGGLDGRGLALGTIGTLCLLNGLVALRGDSPLQAGLLLAGALAAFGAFVWWQRRLAASGGTPLMNLALFQYRQFAMGSVVAFIYGTALFGSTYLLPVYMQVGLHLSASHVGTILLPAGIVLALTIAGVGRLADRHPTWVLVTIGLALLAASFALMMVLRLDSALWLLVAFAIIGRIGLGFILPSLNLGSMRPLAKPLIEDGGICILRGNLAPRGAVLKPSAATPELMKHRGRAVVFEDFNHYKERINDPDLDVDASCVLVMKNVGPKGYPGMAEVGNMGLPPKVLATGVKDMVRISDARMSGTAYGTVILHVAPEAAAGGPLGIVQDGDFIELDAYAGKLQLDISDEEMQRRLAERAKVLAERKPEMVGGYQSLYVDRVLQADEGCDFDFLVGCRGAAVPKHSH